MARAASSVGLIDCVIDDNKNKNGLFMPKSTLPIVGSDVLFDKNYKLCLLSLNPINEDKIVNKLRGEIGFSGKIFSIFPHSKYSFLIDITGNPFIESKIYCQPVVDESAFQSSFIFLQELGF